LVNNFNTTFHVKATQYNNFPYGSTSIEEFFKNDPDAASPPSQAQVLDIKKVRHRLESKPYTTNNQYDGMVLLGSYYEHKKSDFDYYLFFEFGDYCYKIYAPRSLKLELVCSDSIKLLSVNETKTCIYHGVI